MGKDNLYDKIESLPENLKTEVEDFVDFLYEKKAGLKNTGLKQRQFGSMKGTFTILPDFDKPVDDFKDYM